MDLTQKEAKKMGIKRRREQEQKKKQEHQQQQIGKK